MPKFLFRIDIVFNETSCLLSFSAFLVQSAFKCSTLPQNLQPPPLGYSPFGLSGHDFARCPTSLHIKQTANLYASAPFSLETHSLDV